MKRTRMVLPLIILAVVLVPLWGFAQQGAAPAAPGAAQSQPGHQGHGDGAKSGQGHGAAEGDGGHHKMCKDMMAQHDQMVADMKAMNAKLDEMVGAMNAAKGDQKIAAMANVIAEMTAQRKQMFDKFGSMHQMKMKCAKMGGMGHGRHHGDGAGGHGGKGGGCPMMEKHGESGKTQAPAGGTS